MIDEKSQHYVQTKDSPKKLTLKIPTVSVSDIGQYTVKVTDKSGDTSVSMVLNVVTEQEV